MNININAPLGLPQGSIRAILALSLTWGILAMLVIGIKVPVELWTITNVVLTWYFSTRPTDKEVGPTEPVDTGEETPLEEGK